MNLDNNNNHQEENQNQFLNIEVINNNSLYNQEEFNYSLRYTKITLSFIIILFIKLIFIIYFHFFENSDNFLYHQDIIISYNQYYRCITRYFINFGYCHLIIELILAYILFFLYENMIGTLFTIILIFVSFIIISIVNLGLIELTKFIFNITSHKSNIDNEYEGGLTPLFFTLYTFYFSFEGNSNKIFFFLFIFIVRAKHSEYLLFLILIFFTPNNSIYGNFSGILTAYFLKSLKKYLLPKIIWIKEIETVLFLYKLFPLYRYINEENPIMKKILYEFDIDSVNELNLIGELENGQQMTELTLLSSENENSNHNNN